jgi:hypothetical protein
MHQFGECGIGRERLMVQAKLRADDVAQERVWATLLAIVVHKMKEVRDILKRGDRSIAAGYPVYGFS